MYLKNCSWSSLELQKQKNSKKKFVLFSKKLQIEWLTLDKSEFCV